MARIVRGGLIQATLCEPATSSVAKIKQAMNDKHEALLAQAVDKGAQIVCFQELFHGPYFCAEQQTKWYDLVERVPDGPTTKRFSELAKKYGIALVLPVYEARSWATRGLKSTLRMINGDSITRPNPARFLEVRHEQAA